MPCTKPPGRETRTAVTMTCTNMIDETANLQIVSGAEGRRHDSSCHPVKDVFTT